ncbi:MAG: cation:proton antiporter [Proteobacteria bacterium]|nr:cation:proton antiporter [Pseudomonadota bacterium]
MHLDPIVNVLLGLSIVILAAKVGAVLANSFKQPLVLGELLAGVTLASFSLLGFNGFDFLKDNSTLEIFSSLGVIILLFEVGLESQLSEMVAVGMKSLLVASIGVIMPFILGYYVSGMIIQDLPNISKIFIGAMLTATSVGITARVFKDLNFLGTKEAKIVLGAAVIDDILGLIILAVVSGIAVTGVIDFISIGSISLKAIIFILLSVLAGLFLAKRLNNKRDGETEDSGHPQNGTARKPRLWDVPGMMLSLALLICFMGAYLANQFGLATIVGAFCMGLILDDVHFKDFHSSKTIEETAAQRAVSRLRRTNDRSVLQVHEDHEDDENAENGVVQRSLEEYIQPISMFLVPIFFVVTGLNVDVSVLQDPTVIYSSIALCLVAILSKLACGWAFPSKEKFSRILIGVSMIPRGEVGLIFASVGKSIGVVDDRLYAIAVIVVITTTLVTPPILAFLIDKLSKTGTNEQS